MTIDQALVHLLALAKAEDKTALDHAAETIDALLAPLADDRPESVRVLGDLQDRLGRQAPRTPLRADMLDLLGARILSLLEADS